LVVIGAIPYVGGPLTTWLGQHQQQAAFDRIISVLREVAGRLNALEQAGKNIHTDEPFAELVTNVLPLVARTRSAEKRSRYADLLSQAAMRIEPPQRDEARTMALLLDALEYSHIELLDRIMANPATQKHHGLWGAQRHVPAELGHFSRDDGDLLLRLEGLGLLDLRDFRASRKPRGEGQIIVNSLGVQFHSWIRAAHGEQTT
jgi:hypothetical protein